jgi:hypothetical protein
VEERGSDVVQMAKQGEYAFALLVVPNLNKRGYKLNVKLQTLIL